MTITLATLPDATPQQVFDQVKNHLLTQQEKSSRADGFCLYRNDSGLACAAGCLMSDEEAAEIEEGRGWFALVDVNQAPMTTHYEMICDLQELHDNDPVRLWEEGLNRIADRYGLEY